MINLLLMVASVALCVLGTVAAASAPDLSWSQILDSGEKGAKIAAIAAAAVVGYYKFIRGRVFRPRLEMTVSSSLLLVASQEYIKVVATLKNTGASRIIFDLPNSALRIFAVPRLAKGIVDSVAWENIGTLDVSGRHSWIEPAETVYENWLIALPTTATNPAFRSELRIAGKKTAWYADTIVERQPLLLSVSPKDSNSPSERKQEMPDQVQTPKDDKENERIRREKEEQERRRNEERRRQQEQDNQGQFR
jgi:hypothetical protein